MSATMGCFAKALLLLITLMCYLIYSFATSVTYDERAIVIDGERRVLITGSIHYPRSTDEMWPDLIQKAKDGGLDAIETYIFWNAHEPRKGQYNFMGNLDFTKFIRIVQEKGLYVILRIGPYVCAEWNYGGLPVWLHQIPGIEIRTDNEIFKAEMQIFTTLIVDMVKRQNLLAPQGGPIIITQIENEYGNIMDKYGDAGKRYIQWCAQMAASLNVNVPWIMCQQADAPPPMINTCNGFYCHSFKPNRPSPKMWTENWTGWFQGWGQSRPHRAAEDVAFSVAYFFANGGTLQNYYMYHGGTNFGRSSGGPYIITSYDYDAPLDEYGYIRQPKWGHLKELHSVIKMMEKIIAYGDVNTTTLGDGLTVTKYYISNTNDSGCFIINENQASDANVTYNGNSYFVPSKSISILRDCQEEVYNTAKVNAPTSTTVYKPIESTKFYWQWRPEIISDTLKGIGMFSNNSLLEQIITTGDVSDYLWYTTSVTVEKYSPFWGNNIKLHVSTKGHILHAYVNKRLIGSQYGGNGNYRFEFERDVKIRKGHNVITLLSATNGLANYGEFFDLQRAGIDGGPIELIGNANSTFNLSSNSWSYKIGLDGERRHLQLPQKSRKYKWYSYQLPVNRPMTWYKTKFEVPDGDDSLVLDLQGMGRGHAWVNGQSIGRYWPSFLATDQGCQPCDYREPYEANKCRTDCGKPSQRWYHIPRSFTTKGPNTLILFEEVGGNTSQIRLNTVVTKNS